MFSAMMLNCGANPNLLGVYHIFLTTNLSIIFFGKLSIIFSYYITMLLIFHRNYCALFILLMHLLKLYSDGNVEIRNFFVQIGPNIAFLKVKWDVAKLIAIAFAQNVPLCSRIFLSKNLNSVF